MDLANTLQSINSPPLLPLLGFVVVTFILDLVITGAIPKWAIFAPIFVPLPRLASGDAREVLAGVPLLDDWRDAARAKRAAT